MAVAVLGHYDESNLIGVMRPTRRLDRRHYKKDSRFVLDLYTLTYDEHESLDSLGDLADRRCESLKNNMNLRNNGRSAGIGYRYRRPSLHSRMQDGKNMQLCFVNEQSSETEDNHVEDGIFSLPVIPQSYYPDQQDMDLTSLPVEHTNATEMCHRLTIRSNETTEPKTYADNNNNNDKQSYCAPVFQNGEAVTTNINCNSPKQWQDPYATRKFCEETKSKANTEIRQRSDSPITCTIKTSLKKVGAETGNSYNGRHRMNRQMLTKLNADQLQMIINDLHAHVEYLNEQLMKMLMDRDELHMKRDSFLVDIEDLTTYLDARQLYQSKDLQFDRKNKNYIEKNAQGNIPRNSCTKNLISGLRFDRFTSYIKN